MVATQLFQKEPVQNTLGEPVQNSVPNWLADLRKNIEKHWSDTNLALPGASGQGKIEAFRTGSQGHSTDPESQFRTQSVPNWLAGVPNWLEAFRTGSFRTGSRLQRSPENPHFDMNLTML